MEELFGGAAPYYARYRPGYGKAAIAFLARTLGADSQVLDLGCGPGTIAIPLARRVRAVLAVDPAEEMLAEGRRLAAGVPAVRWLRGDSTTLRALPPFDHVVMGRSFHWMDRAAVLAELDELLPPGGTVALLGPAGRPGEPWQPDAQPWQAIERRVCADFGLDIDAAAASFHATGEPHHDLLAASPFRRLESRTFARRLVWDVDGLVGLQLSYSYSSPAVLGDRLGAFVVAFREALLAGNPAGRWEQDLVTEVLIAGRTEPRPPARTRRSSTSW
ncbi:class I SAM-dependent methyltransferase [Nonomuraea sp. SMC257]|uniref:Class I SAM-dependent methyltransferase n=1 Tax=Nonomuraea montanisoli TaxID=2741721 RepID=A0A7Y6M523_9ACTN|nr:class I SAM-dependent methyltransferase [Nonomuraea montanisoli]NUW34070.1 class I SAM-dependent methyltransferase [Nonomuraea montanisoli]